MDNIKDKPSDFELAVKYAAEKAVLKFVTEGDGLCLTMKAV